MAHRFAEELPENCPPADAISPDSKTFYRLVSNNPPVDDDFRSQRKLFPARQFNVDECQALSLSVFSDVESIKQILKFKTHKNKKIAQILLAAADGVVKQTGNTVSHYSWWKTTDFQPNNAHVIDL